MRNDSSSLLLPAARDLAFWPEISALRIPCPSESLFVLVVSAIWLLFYNGGFWRQTLSAMWHPSFSGALFIVSLCALVLTLHVLLLFLAPSRGTLRAFTGILFLIAAIGSYFVNSFGVLLNKDMLRNVAQTDVAEIGDLLSPSLVLHFIIFGAIPALLVWRVNLPAMSWKKRLKQRTAFLGSALFLSLAGLFASSASYAVYFRAHKPVRYALVPVMPVASAIDLTTDSWKSARNAALIDLSGTVRRTAVAAASSKPLVLFIVVGETARAANFQLGGYQRHTNPRLAAIDGLVYFDRASSCGTATAISVPCLFSHFGREHFSVDRARNHSNVLDSLVKAGLDVEWRDNNAGCKGVCARVARIQYMPAKGSREHCPNSYCYDEVMLTDLAGKLRHVKRDTVIVFHLIGSHGPAYSERYPAESAIFKPACRSNELQRCTQQEILNAYDNTIAYTDRVLAQQIELLRAAQDRVDSVLIYASDHGESLGEQGVYLHGMPYRFAPATQKRIPLLLWTSHGYADRTQLSLECLRSTRHQPVSHDNLYHTVLGAAQVRNALYDAKLDMLQACRST